ncbi:toll-like receptor 6 [Python bivittatus]|uniref:Toll-like receptor 6 n=1 Tax=Python bivittatus TaxID=176946 RepID=A0A9F2WD27_PYTBI|nr:toll-like receptor 6 [Python bivittatus]
MAGRKVSDANNFLSICIFMITLWNFTHASMEHGFIANYSKSSLTIVPKHLSAQTTVLDLSDNRIHELEISDFHSLSNLQVLILSNNSIRELDFSVFQYNKVLEHLDLSHNKLWNFSGLPVKSLKHLDLSYNDFITMPLSPEFGRTLKLNYFALSIRNISIVSALTYLQVDTLFLDLEYLSEYSSGSLLVFNAKTVQIVVPQNANFHVLLDLQFNGTESLELSKIPSEQVEDLGTFLSKLNKKSALLNLTVTDITLTWKKLIEVFEAVGRSSINYLTILYPSLTEINYEYFNGADTSLKGLAIKYVQVYTVEFDQDIVYRAFSNMNIETLTISDSSIFYMRCPARPSRFKYLCFQNNTLTDTIFEDCNNLGMLETLILQKNRLDDLTKVSLMTTSMKSLNYMDISYNHLQYKDSGNKCNWNGNIIKLNLSSNKLTESVFRCLPNNIQILDLQSNQISTVPREIIDLIALEELNLASNKLNAFPGCGYFRNLQVLNVENNFVLDQFSEFSQTCQNIQRLKGGRNPFRCNCELRQLINLQKQSVELIGWPDFYKCEYPSDLRGTLLKDFHISELDCNVTLMITVVLVVALVLMAIVSFLCIRFDIPWYFKMIWRWTQVKHRIWKKKSEEILENVQYHAFISYSEHDSDWVKNELIPNLEKEDGSLRICQHERNFIAGKSIVENIIDCIEQSYKSVFVLSPNFVQSEWCHYELYFAHHKLFNENGDGLILILLEPIPAYIIPARYYKLKALMAKRTYLEWPKEKRKHAFFWTNLRTALQIKLPYSEENRALGTAWMGNDLLQI